MCKNARETTRRSPPSLIDALFTCIVRLDGLRLDHTRRVAFLPAFRLSRNGSRHVAGTQPESRAQRRQRRNQYGDDDLNDLLLRHRLPPFVSRADAEHRTPVRTLSRGKR